ncbi:MAG TPA: glycosyltransferase [Marmoricola sp.]|jgi:glycosyltransferase involved in cell wall biosynthesis|nr:glycosyltransferase [Marmoricola sp.]
MPPEDCRDADTISVLLPVHRGIDPAHLGAALATISTQTLRADEVVVVEDGPLDEGHRSILEAFAQSTPSVVVRVRLAENAGAGVANQAGLERARSTWIAKADADDLNEPDRLARQLSFVRARGLDLAGAAMAEFDTDPAVVRRVRTAPADQASIERRLRVNSPFNHPTTFYRRSVALAAGGYADLRYMQDYDLFARMVAGGARCANAPDIAVRFRADASMYGRRRSREMDACERRLQANLHTYGLIGRGRMVRNIAVRSAARRLPEPVLRLAYQVLLTDRG